MAQDYPELFDGIVAGTPAISWDKFAAAGLWIPFVAQSLGKQHMTFVGNILHTLLMELSLRRYSTTTMRR